MMISLRRAESIVGVVVALVNLVNVWFLRGVFVSRINAFPGGRLGQGSSDRIRFSSGSRGYV